ncbi:zinc ribbon domain-containing protein [Magnetospirillum sp. UT-4]|uniref:FmdB family zinc ribbon protein n=1 Tax=Magnetospirillum sp. UT-4 TaxID=2681467 RepID=UPI001380056D|nr:zinc ribbon domain-containing protein [Magnetospirillum sp. UT-4]CAA7619714.1 Regulatory protein [Magnetospirillum sp. UT-4]
MPLYSYRCSGCGQEFETLVRGDEVPACPGCGATTLERLVSVTAAEGRSGQVIGAARRLAAREGHMSNFSKAERKRR